MEETESITTKNSSIWNIHSHIESQSKSYIWSINSQISNNDKESDVKINKYTFIPKSKEVANETLLKDTLTENRKLVPVDKLHKILEHEGQIDYFHLDYNIFPLEWFDDYEFESMSPERWLSIPNLQGEAFLPKRRGFHFENRASTSGSVAMSAFSDSSYVQDLKDRARMRAIKKQFQTYLNNIYGWTMVNILGYNHETFMWQVFEPRLRRRYEVPRIYLRFLIEDPDKFTTRIKYAIKKRDIFENNFKFGFII